MASLYCSPFLKNSARVFPFFCIGAAPSTRETDVRLSPKRGDHRNPLGTAREVAHQIHLRFQDSILGSHIRELSLDQEIEEYDMEREMENFLQVGGSSNGVVCLADNIFPKNSGVCLLWNPSIQKVILLPDPNIGANFGGFTSNCSIIRSLGFGYDPKTDDYKLVKVLYLRDPAYTTLHRLPVEIYTLRTGAWRTVMAPAPPYVTEKGFMLVFLNVAFHWRVHTPRGQGAFRNVIVSLNMEDETFGEMAMPKSFEGLEYMNVNLAVVDGLLAIVPCCNYWGHLIDEYPLRVGDERMIGFTKNGEVLVVDYDDNLSSYEPNSQRALDLHIGDAITVVFFGYLYGEPCSYLMQETDQFREEI
ncbi:F-box/kelch-repeat protein At3g06240-like [Corylus avellana]|uniref:F-box/kelch-repeat protein At3g06240-like n=1 Tax=Corylus avellana TaxID=13451 RepID=UPI00286A8286|nr:F-box/kelch-repeat protein At3g06240-like [Corylus avellana]